MQREIIDALPDISDADTQRRHLQMAMQHEGPPPVSERERVEAFLAGVSRGHMLMAELWALTSGTRIDDKAKAPAFKIPPGLTQIYRGALADAVTSKSGADPERCMTWAAALNGKIIKAPIPQITRHGFSMVDRVAATSPQAGLSYAYLLVISAFKSQLCRCSFCQDFFLAPKSKGRGRTPRTYCTPRHRKQAAAATASLRAQASRAGVPFKKWKTITEADPEMTPGKWDKKQIAIARRRA